MKIKKLEITGFKSFLDKTCIEFSPGISAIVGPNGCGKSNIVDALRWAMGEQSVKQLRGKAMEDIIFSGASNTSPVNIAEVSLTLSNDNGTAPDEFKDLTEIMLTRRLFRSGESAYFINKQATRLKDIHDIFLGSGMGSKSYAVIQQGNIGAITDAGTEERRMFIEEAAGVTRYKNRKKEALQKVDLINQNLLRVKDIISEIERQMKSLKRQAGKAQIYQTYKDNIRRLDVILATYYYDNYSKEIECTDSLLTSVKDTDLGDTTKLQQLNTVVEDIKLKLMQKKEQISKQQSRRFELQRNLDRLENDLSHLQADQERFSNEILQLEQEKQELEKKDAEILHEISHLQHDLLQNVSDTNRIRDSLDQEHHASGATQTRLTDLNRQLETNKTGLMDLITQETRYKNICQNAATNRENLKRRLKRIDEQELVGRKKTTQLESQHTLISNQLDEQLQSLDELKNAVEQAKADLEHEKHELQHQIKMLQALELEHGKLKSKYTTLKKMESSLQWYKDGVKAVVSAPELSGIIGLAADIFEPESSFETAIEAVLGERLQYVLVEDQQNAEQALNFLKIQSRGRCGFIPASCAAPGNSDEELSGVEPDQCLMNHVAIRAGGEPIAALWLKHTFVVETIEEALDLRNQLSAPVTAPFTIVTRDGDVISDYGAIIGGSKDTLSGILIKKQEIRELEFQLDTLNQQLLTSRRILKEQEAALRSSEQALQQRLSHKAQADALKIELEKDLFKFQEEIKHARHHLEILQLEQEQLQGEEDDLDDEIHQCSQRVTALTDRIQDTHRTVTELSGKIESVSSTMAGYTQKILDLKLELTSLTAKHDNITSTLKRLREFQEDGSSRLKHLAEEINNKRLLIERSTQKNEESAHTLAELYDELKGLEQALAQNEAAFREIDTALRQNNNIISDLQSRRENSLQKIRVIEIEQTQRIFKRDTLVSQIEDRYHESFKQLKTRVEATGENQPVGIDDAEKQLAEYKRKIMRITDVNLGAIKEYDQLKTRYDFLVEQHDDLVKAIEDLHKVIKKINRITQQKFTETLDQINEKLEEVFPLLFGGGTARLVLTDPDSPLNSGVEFMIHPPGKKLTRLSLLSGGEKALSAIAFIFSIFLIKPSSFCLLDEIDAPLDEANVIKFNTMLKKIGKKSQIIMITHNKRSMEFADILFGITMEQKGISKMVSVNLDGSTKHQEAS